jgi:hypothetical protein
LQAGIGYRPGDRRACATGQSVTFAVVLRNVGKKKISLSHIEPVFMEWMPIVKNATGQRASVATGPLSLGEVPIVWRSLAPGQQIILGHPCFLLRPPGWRGEVVAPTIAVVPGRYQVSYSGLPVRLKDAKASTYTPATGWVELEVAAPAPAGAGDAVLARHNAWVKKCYEEVRKIKPGMTRADLRERFVPAGGLYKRTLRSYSYKPCPYFKISVTFEAVGGKDEKERPGDRIVRVSTPYFEDPLAE